ncbi:MAG: CerR family C-terminal domain-containing protein [Rhodoferax sp.]
MADSSSLSVPAAAVASPPAVPVSYNGTPLRSDGVEARNRLLLAALGLFAAKGYSKTSTREIAKAAGANLAAISYYFGDKAGLYRAVYNDPMGCGPEGMAEFAAEGLELRQALAVFLQGFTDPLKQGDLAQQMLQLHFREMLEPMGLWQAHIDQFIAPMHQGLIEVLMRHLGLPEPDDDLHRLVFAITGLGIQMFIGADIMRTVRPALINSPQAIDLYSQRLADFAVALVDEERRRRST